MENKILYIEDYNFQRDAILDKFQSQKFHNVLAPINIDECESFISSNEFIGAIIDYNLHDWLGSVNAVPITIDGHECINGIEVAERLIEKNKGIQIGIFSSHPEALKNAIANSPIKDIIEIVEEKKGKRPNDHLVEFLEKFYKLEIVIKPLHKISEELPPEIKSFFSKKLMSSLSMGEYFWKAGKYSWLVGVNKDISYRFSEIEKLGNDYTNENAEEKFFLGIDKDDFSLSVIIDKLSNTKIAKEEIFTGTPSLEYKTNKFLFDYFITQLSCRKYLAKEITLSKFVEIINTLGEYAKFESQKILFKSAAKEGAAKEKIYEQLSGFSENGFQKILDIYTGSVDDIQNNVAFVKLGSVSCGDAVRVEKFNMDFLTLNSMEENSQFEYTIFRLPYGGTTSHIELL